MGKRKGRYAKRRKERLAQRAAAKSGISVDINLIPEIKPFDDAPGYKDLYEKHVPENFKRTRHFQNPSAGSPEFWDERVTNLFFNGGNIGDRREGVPSETYNRVIRYFKNVMGSWTPQHEEKTALCAWLLSLVCKA